MKILSIQIVVRDGFADHVSVQTDLPSTMPNISPECMDFQFKVACGNGKAYCEQHFPGVPIGIIDANHFRFKFGT